MRDRAGMRFCTVAFWIGLTHPFKKKAMSPDMARNGEHQGHEGHV